MLKFVRAREFSELRSNTSGNLLFEFGKGAIDIESAPGLDAIVLDVDAI